VKKFRSLKFKDLGVWSFTALQPDYNLQHSINLKY